MVPFSGFGQPDPLSDVSRGRGSATALLIGLIIGPRFINMLRMKQGKDSRSAKMGPKPIWPSAARPRWAG
jgi:phospho-N-acetylmuramoyl-pentapeptide-transferase